MESPYRGLQPFGPEDLAFFSGRGQDIRLIVAGMFASPLTLLFGPSGVGKSSVLYAGVLPQLSERKNVLAVGVRDWSHDPVRSIGEALAQAAGGTFRGDLGELLEACVGADRRRVMLVLDQFEHALGERDADEALVESLSAVLLRADLPVCALIAIREDALAGLDRFDGRLPGLFDSALRLEYMDREAGRDAIRIPLAAWERATGEHVTADDELVEAVLDAVPAGRCADGIETAQLQLVMARVWETERAAGSSRLRRATFAALGGADGIVRTHVRDALDGMPAAERELAAVALDRLVTPSGARIAHLTEDLARYAGGGAATLRPILERLSTARVLRPVAAAGEGGPRFEVYHELLADAVLGWLTDHEADRRAAAAGARLRKRVLVLGTLVVAAVVVGVILAGALIAEKRSSEMASSRADSATARRLLASGGDPQLALALALRAADTRPTREARLALRAVLAQSYERAVLRGAPDGVRWVDVSPDGRTLLTAEADDSVRVRDRRTGRPLRMLTAPGVQQAVFCRDGARYAFAGDGGAAIVTGGTRFALTREPVSAIACSEDGTTVAIRLFDRVRVFDARTRKAMAPLEAPASGTLGTVALSADGSRVAADVAGGTLVADLRGRRQRAVLLPARDGEQVASVALSPDGRRVVTGGTEGTVLVASVSSRQTVDELVGNASYVSSVAFTQDGALIVSAAGDRTARVWDAASGVQLAELRGHESLVRNATFGRDGQTVATASEDGTLRLWQLPVTTVVRSTSELADAVVSKDGRRIVSATRDGTIDVSDVPSGRRTARFTVRGLARFAVSPSASAIAAIEGSGHVRARDPGRPEAPVDIAEPGAEVRALDYSPDGRSIALATYTGAIRVVDTSGRVRRMLRLPELAPLTVVAFSPDGRRIAAGAPLDNTIVVVDARTGRELRRIRPEDSGITSLAFSPDASLLIAGGNDGASIWNASTGRLRLRLRGHRAAVQTSTFSPSGDLVETASFDGEARLWDATTGDLLTSLAGRTGSFGGDRYVLTTTGRVARLYACDACGSLAALQARGRDRVTRQFSDAQLRPYIEG